MIKNNINKAIEAYKDINYHIDKIEEIVMVLTEALINDNKIILSSSNTLSFLMQHFQSLLSCKYKYERPSFPVLNLMNSYLMNDFLCSDLKKEDFFSVQLKDLSLDGDVLLYFSNIEEEKVFNSLSEIALDKNLKIVLINNQLSKINVIYDNILNLKIKSQSSFETNEVFLFLFYQILDLIEYQLFSYED